jgi:hypothetical protein
MLMFLQLLLAAIVIGVPAAGLAQFRDKGDHVEVKKGTRLCSIIEGDGVRETLSRRPIFWRVTSPVRANGTQAVSALVRESVYNRRTGDTTIIENPYEENFAIFFKRDPDHTGMLQMISPRDGSIQAIVDICPKGK